MAPDSDSTDLQAFSSSSNGICSRLFSSSADDTRGSSPRALSGRSDRWRGTEQPPAPDMRNSTHPAPTPRPRSSPPQTASAPPQHGAPRSTHPSSRTSTPPTAMPFNHDTLQAIRTFEQLRYALQQAPLPSLALPQLVQVMSRLVAIHRMQGLYETTPMAQHVAELVALRLLPHLHTLSSSTTAELLWCMAHLGLPGLGYRPPDRHASASTAHSSQAPAPSSLQAGLLARLAELGWSEFSQQDASRVVWAAAKLQQKQRKSPLRRQPHSHHLHPHHLHNQQQQQLQVAGAAPGLGDELWWDNLAEAMLAGRATAQQGQKGLQVEDWADVMWAFGQVVYKGPVRGRLCSAAADALLQRHTRAPEAASDGGERRDVGGGVLGRHEAQQQQQQQQPRGVLRGGLRRESGLGDGFFLNASSGRVAGLLHALAVMGQSQPELVQRGAEALLEHGSSIRTKPELFKAALGHLGAPGVTLKPADLSVALWACAKAATPADQVRSFLTEFVTAQEQRSGVSLGDTDRDTRPSAPPNGPAGSGGSASGGSSQPSQSQQQQQQQPSGSSGAAPPHSPLSRMSVNAAANCLWALAEMQLLGPADTPVLDSIVRPLLSLLHTSLPPAPSPPTAGQVPQTAAPYDLLSTHKLALIQLAQVHHALQSAGAPAGLRVRPDLVARGALNCVDERRNRRVSRGHGHMASPAQTAAALLQSAVGTRGLVSVEQGVSVLDGVLAAGLVVNLQRKGQEGVRRLAVEVEGESQAIRESNGGRRGLRHALLAHVFGAENVVVVGNEEVDWLTLEAQAGTAHLLDVLGADS
ncbi:MAG: hypothetical protein WDW38_002424 [Sanguina aurantia]